MCRTLSVAVLGLVAFPLSAFSQEVVVEIHNLTNGDLLVSEAFGKGDLVSRGWMLIKPTEEKSIKLDGRRNPCLRVEQGGREVTFSNYGKFIEFPAIQERFTVTNTDNPAFSALKWGDKLENVYSLRRGERLPDSWGVVRYFVIPTGSARQHLEVLPPK